MRIKSFIAASSLSLSVAVISRDSFSVNLLAVSLTTANAFGRTALPLPLRRSLVDGRTVERLQLDGACQLREATFKRTLFENDNLPLKEITDLMKDYTVRSEGNGFVWGTTSKVLLIL